jgi:hypothetical protein
MKIRLLLGILGFGLLLVKPGGVWAAAACIPADCKSPRPVDIESHCEKYLVNGYPKYCVQRWTTISVTCDAECRYDKHPPSAGTYFTCNSETLVEGGCPQTQISFIGPGTCCINDGGGGAYVNITSADSTPSDLTDTDYPYQFNITGAQATSPSVIA